MFQILQRVASSCFRMVLTGTFVALATSEVPAGEPCEIKIVDQSNGWPVPLVQLKTTNEILWVSDNDGVVAIDDPDLMNVPTWFTVQGHGYSVPKDGFGMQGVRLTPTPGGKLKIQVQRELPAKRLGRLTGSGLFAESQKLGQHQDWKESGRWGCDTVQTAVHNGKLYWGWGDTTLPGYPLGLFQMTGATTDLKPIQNWQPPLKLSFDLFRDQRDQPRNVAKIPGPGPSWLGGYVSLKDRSGKSHLVATYSKIEPPLETYEAGLCEWDEQQELFLPSKVLWSQENDGGKPPAAPNGHVVRWTDSEGKKWLLVGDPFPEWKIPDSYESWMDPASWTELEPQREVATLDGESIRTHRGSIAFLPYRQRWGCVFCQYFGKSSALGELWYCEADSPFGPWEGAQHIVTHQQYTFYNPHLHPEMVPDGSPILLFEATYTKTFSKTVSGTPRYEYNQVLYRLDLDELKGPGVAETQER